MMRHEVISNEQAIRKLAPQWNELWVCGGSMVAGSRAETLALHHRQFSPDSQRAMIVVRDGRDRLVAGLPLFRPADSKLLSTFQSCSNEWHQCGHMLVAVDTSLEEAVSEIVNGMKRLRASNIWLDWIPVDRPEWLTLADESRRRGWGVQMKSRFEVGITRLPASWEEFEKGQSKNNRRKCRTELKRLSEQGEVRLEVISAGTADELQRAIREALAIEMDSWKGTAGSAISCHPHIESFFLRWAEELNKAGLFRLFLLRLNERAIAFDLGSTGGGWYRSKKVSFREEFGNYSPGHVLNQLVIRHFIEDPDIHTIDSIGPMNEANRRWSNDRYRIGRLVIAPGSWISNTPGRSIVSLLNARSAWNGTAVSPDDSAIPTEPTGN